MELKDSKTKENLMRAFAGESQARNRYTFAAQLAMENNLYVIKEVFDLTAKQETEHAEVFYRFLKEIEGMEVVINGAGYPVNTSQNVEQLLADAMHNETQESDDIYREFGDVALEEGFNHIAGKFYMIAEIEKSHAKRFIQEEKAGWMCLNCGYIVEATAAPQNCPVCDSNQGYFVRAKMAPMYVDGMGEGKEQDLGR